MRTIIIICAFILLAGCLKDDPLNLPFNSFQPVELNDGITISSPAAELIDHNELKTIYEDIYNDPNLWSLKSMLVFRNGRLVSESYLKDSEDIGRRQLIWSCTKQVMGVLAGIAIDEGLINSVDDPLSYYLPEELEGHPEKSAITIRQLITMHSGIDFNNDGIGGQTDRILRGIPGNITSYILSLPMKSVPGSEFYYNDGDPQLVSSIIQSVTGMPADKWAQEVLFSKLGITDYKWNRYKDGTTLGGFGIEMKPRDLGKIALCVSNNGVYNNEQVIPAWWINEMCTPRSDTPLGYSFGFFWWIDISRGIYFMWGHGGQFAFIVPSRSLVVIMTSIPNTQGDYQVEADEVLPVIDRITGICF